MINTDASGQGSLVYGKTSDHVLGLRAVLMGGDILDTQAVPVALAETLGNTPSTVGRIYNTVYQRCKAQRDLIIDKFPKLNRFLTGYDLRHVFNDEMSEFDLTRILTGFGRDAGVYYRSAAGYHPPAEGAPSGQRQI
ncbi:putative oxidase [Klebsiella pneumoniae]|nr:putative oxidase [Klebsiella pneumoniae]